MYPFTPDVLFEDDDILIVSKPAGVVTNQADTVTGPTLQDWFAEVVSTPNNVSPDEWRQQLPDDIPTEFGSPEDIFQERLGMVHRLDKDTSGVMVWAKHPGSLSSLLAQFRNRTIQKKYVCLVHGVFTIQEDTIRMPLARDSQNRKKIRIDTSGRNAETEYKVIKQYKHLETPNITRKLRQSHPEEKNFKKRSGVYQGFSYVACWPKTGRTHQIRVHMKALSHPLVGDVKYLGHKRAQLDPLWCPRQFLHAAALTFTHPRTGQAVTFEAPLAPDLEEVLTLLIE